MLEISEEEKKTFEIWYKKHKKKCKEKKNQIILTITPTGIGNNIIAKCPYCGKEKDITDYSSW